MIKIILFSSLLCVLSFAEIDDSVEMPIFSAPITRVTSAEGKLESEYRYELTMYKLVNSQIHPSSFTLCRICNSEKCEKQDENWECQRYFLTKQKEALRCNAARYTANAGFDAGSLVVDESSENGGCNTNSSDLDKRTKWIARTYFDGKLDKNFSGYPHLVH